MPNKLRTFGVMLSFAAGVLFSCRHACAGDFSAALNQAWALMLPGQGPIAGEAPPVPAARKPEAAAPAAASRTVFKGRIREIILASGNNPGSLQGSVTVAREDGSARTFLVSKWTFIMVVSPAGYGYAGLLRQLEPGWTCQVAYDLPEDDGWDQDKASLGEGQEPEFADNMVVYYKR